MRKTLAAAIAFLFVAASCAPPPTSVQTAKPVEELVFAVPALGTGGVIDPILSTLDDKPFNRLVYSYLFDTDLTDTRLSKDTSLASDWTWSDDRKALRVVLRKGVKFHNGATVTAQDVKFSVGRLADKAARAPYAQTVTQLLNDVEIIGDSELIFHLKQPSLTFLELLSPIQGGSEGFVIPEAYFKQVGAIGFQQQPIGTGPYRIARYESNSVLELEAFTDYFLGAPKIRRFVFKVMPELSTRVAALKTGGADVISIARDRLQEMTNAGYNIHKRAVQDLPVILQPHVWGKDPRKSLENMDVRKALELAINLDEINKFLLAGAGTLTDNWVYGAVGAQPIAPHPYDPQTAAQLLRSAGFPPGDLKLTLYVGLKTDYPEAKDVGQAIAGYWDAIGVKTTVIPEDYGTLRPKMLEKSLSVPSYRIQTSTVRPLYGPLLKSFYGCPTSNLLTICDPTLSALIDQLDKVPSIEEYGKTQQMIGQRMHDNYDSMVLHVLGSLYASNDKVRDWNLGVSAYDTNLRYLALRERKQ